MKKTALIIIVLLTMSGQELLSQDSRALRAARNSFSSAERNYQNGNYEEAAREFEIAVNTIPATTDSRRHLNIRLESLINLTDIYFYRYININKACEYTNMFLSNMNSIRNKGTLRSSELLDYQRKEAEFKADHLSKCENYRGIERDMNRFEKRFEKEFEHQD